MARLLGAGPRNRRRLATAAIGLGLIAAIVAALVLTRPAGRSAPAAAVRSAQSSNRFGANQDKLVYGMTKQQVRRLVGPPAKTIGDCWQYPVHVVRPNGRTFDFQTRVCFYEGRYASDENQVDGKWGYNPKVTFPGS